MGFNRRRVLIVVALTLVSLVGIGALVVWKYRRGERAEALLASIKSHLESRQFDKAKLESEKLIRINGQNAKAQYMRALSLLAGRDPGSIRTTDEESLNAVRALLAAAKIDPTMIDVQRKILTFYTGQRNYTDCILSAQEIVRQVPDDPQANHALARALVQQNRQVEARKYVDALISQEKSIRPRTAALAAAVGEGLGKDGQSLREVASEALIKYSQQNSKFESVDDRISLVELRTWKALHTGAPPAVVREQLSLAIEELAKLVNDERTNDMLPGFVLDAVGQLIPSVKTQSPALKPIFAEIKQKAEKVTIDTFNLAIERKLLDPRIYTNYAERLRDQNRDADAVAIVKKGLEISATGSDLIKREFCMCHLWLAKHFVGVKQLKDAQPHIDALLASPDWKPWGQLVQGYSLVLEDKFELASPFLQAAVARLGDTNGSAHALYGLCMLRRGFVTQGREHLERGKSLGADGPQFRAWLTMALAEAGDTSEAIRIAQEILGDDKTQGIGKALEGDLRLRVGDFEGADRSLKVALEKAEPSLRPAIRLSQAQLAISRKNWPAAQAILEEIKSSKEFAARAYALEARYYQQVGEIEKSVTLINEAREKFPDSSLLLALQVSSLSQRGKHKDAQVLLEAEQKRFADRELPYLLLAEVYENAQRPDQAIKVLEQAVKTFPKESSFKLRLADKLISNNRSDAVGPILAQLEGDTTVNPTAVPYLQARLLAATGEREKAAEIIEAAYKRDRYNPSIIFLKSQLDAQKGRIDDAVGALEKIPLRNRNLAMLFEMNLAQGQVAKAIALLHQAEAQGQHDTVPVLRRRLVRLLAQREMYPELDAELKEMLARKTTDGDIALVVNLYQTMGKQERSEQIIESALAKQPESAVLNEVAVAIMLDRKDYVSAQKRIAELFKKSEFRSNPTLHALRVRGLINVNDLPMALQAIQSALEIESLAGNPGLVALKVQLLLRINKDSEAAEFANDVKRRFPNLPSAKYTLARSYEALGNAEKAFALLSEVVRLDPADANASHHYLRLLISRGQFGDLEPAIERLITANATKSGQKENALLLGVLGEYHATRGDVGKANAVLRRLERTAENGVIVPYLRGVIAYAEGKLSDAEQSIQLAMIDPNGHVPSTFLLAQIRAQQARFDEALKLLGRIAKSPESPASVPLLRANLLVRTGRIKEAEQACRDYLQLNPSARPFRQLLTQILSDAESPESKQEAISMAEKALAEGVNNPLDFEVYLKVLMQAGRVEPALKILADQAVSKGKSELILAGGRACYSSGLYRDAERYSKRLVNDEPNNLNAKLLLGDSLMKIGGELDSSRKEQAANYESAAVQYREVLKLQPGNMIAANNLAWVVGIHLNKAHRALEELRNALPGALSVSNRELPAEILDTVGVINLQIDHLNDAQKFLEEAVNRKPASAEIQLHLGELYLKQDLPERARRCFEKARQLDGKKEFASKLNKLLK